MFIKRLMQLLRLSPRRRKRYMLLLTLSLFALPLFAGDDETPIQDNSFLVEEAYNQEPGVVQHIFTFQRAQHGSDRVGTFTQEWPVITGLHQLSFTPISQNVDGRRTDDFAINYRYQLIGSGETRVAISPRISVLRSRVQLMLPASVVVSPRIVTHWNLGVTTNPGTLNVGQSTVWLMSHRFNPLIETTWTRDHRSHDLVVSPGIRWSYNLPRGLQIVPGVAVPFDLTAHERSVFLYLSFEHPFRGVK
jgi:hypothetical protein